MKSVKITLSPVQPLCVPFAHFRILQGLAYSLMSGDETLASEVHDRYFHDKKAFKFFCFSDLSGRYSIRNKQLIFKDTFSWEIRSADDRIIHAVVQALRKNPVIEINRQPCEIISCEVTEKHFFTDKLTVRMNTPIVVYNTLQSGYVRYYNPFEQEFYERLARNVKNKWEMFYEEPFSYSIGIECDNPSDDDKCVTHYKETVINAWYGTYRLITSPEVLEFMWHTGIGSKNSMGFGTFTNI